MCPCLPCQQQPVLPVGLKDQIDMQGVMVYCPRCNQVLLPSVKTGGRFGKSLDGVELCVLPEGCLIYAPGEDTELDGAYFGTTFPHLFLMQFPELRPPPPVEVPTYIPRVFGFKVRLNPPRPPPVGDKDDGDQVMKDSALVQNETNAAKT